MADRGLDPIVFTRVRANSCIDISGADGATNVRVDLATGEVYVRGEPDLSQAARVFWAYLRAAVTDR